MVLSHVPSPSISMCQLLRLIHQSWIPPVYIFPLGVFNALAPSQYFGYHPAFSKSMIPESQPSFLINKFRGINKFHGCSERENYIQHCILAVFREHPFFESLKALIRVLRISAIKKIVELSDSDDAILHDILDASSNPSTTR